MRKSRIAAGGITLVLIGTAFMAANTAQASMRAGTAAHTGQAASSRTADRPSGVRVNGARPAITDGCVNGAVCMYTDSGWKTHSPEHSWTVYGCYNLDNETGDRYVFNNQYGGNTATLWTGSNCAGTATTIGDGVNWEGNITPINSISVDS